MNDLFTNLYNKVIGFFHKVEKEENSKEVACNRLRVVLMQDRTNLTPELLERMRLELVELLSKYLEMDQEALELNLEQDGDQMALALSIPVIRAKDPEEIEAAIKDAEEQSEDDEDKSDETGESEEDDQDDKADDNDDSENADVDSEKSENSEDIESEESEVAEDDDKDENTENSEIDNKKDSAPEKSKKSEKSE